MLRCLSTLNDVLIILARSLSQRYDRSVCGYLRTRLERLYILMFNIGLHEHANERYEDCKMRDVYREIYSGKHNIIFIISHDTHVIQQP